MLSWVTKRDVRSGKGSRTRMRWFVASAHAWNSQHRMDWEWGSQLNCQPNDMWRFRRPPIIVFVHLRASTMKRRINCLYPTSVAAVFCWHGVGAAKFYRIRRGVCALLLVGHHNSCDSGWWFELLVGVGDYLHHRFVEFPSRTANGPALRSKRGRADTMAWWQ